MQIQRGKLVRPRRCLLVGQHGIGKSTAARDALILDLEDGSGDIECPESSLRMRGEMTESANT